jgi:hypothetical protein
MATNNIYHIYNAVEQVHYSENGFLMGSANVSIIIDGYEFADGFTFFNVSIWNLDADTLVYGGTKKFASSQDAIDFVVKKFKLTEV